MLKKNLIFTLLAFLGLYVTSCKTAQNLVSEADVQVDSLLQTSVKATSFSDGFRGDKGMRLMFYNVENLFHPEDDSLTRDDEFTPSGMKAWSFYRYNQKLQNIYKVITALGGWEPPAVVGLCEIENRRVLQDLIYKTPLKNHNYKIVHHESTDRRGIDVGFMYRPDKFTYVDHSVIRLRFPFDSTIRTRDVLCVKGVVIGGDTLHILVNHWPSRWGGQSVSEPRRMYVASQVKVYVDSVMSQKPNDKIVIMGDLNDHADDRSLLEVLKATNIIDTSSNKGLFNFMFDMDKNWKMGSHKYAGKWGTLDHIIVTSNLLTDSRSGKISSGKEDCSIFIADFLLTDDSRNMGKQPNRTYIGPKYTVGFSDHLPVFLDVKINP